MENFLHSNLAFLRELRNDNQTKMASVLGLNRSTYIGYENGTSKPTFDGLISIAEYFNISLAELVEKDLSKSDLKRKTAAKISIIESDLNSDLNSDLSTRGAKNIIKNVDLGHYKSNVFDFDSAAAAGEAMLLIHEDKYKVEPTFYLPELGPGIHIRVPIAGDSMHSTIKDGDKAVATMVMEAQEIRQGYIHLILDRDEGLCCKRLYLADKSHFELISDNEIYKPYKRSFKDVLAIFRVRQVHTYDLRPYWNDLRAEMRDIHIKMANFERLLKEK